MPTNMEDASSGTKAITPRFIAISIRSAGVILYQQHSEPTTNVEAPRSNFDEALEQQIRRYERGWQTLADG